MKRDHLSLAAGFLPGFSLLVLLVCRRSVQAGQSIPQWIDHISIGWLWVAAEAVAFFLPFAILVFLVKKNKEIKFDFRFHGFSHHAVPMLMTVAIAMALINLLIDDGMSRLMGQTYDQVQVFAPLLEREQSVFIWLLAIVVIPVFGGQLFFGSGLLSIYAPCGGIPALILCSLCYGLLTGTAVTLFGTWLSMLIFLYVGWALNSIWAGIFVHGIFAVMHFLLLFIARAYSGQELWDVVRLIMIFLTGLFLYLAMQAMEQLMEKGTMRRMEPVRREKMMNSVVFSPGLWMTLFLFIINSVT